MCEPDLRRCLDRWESVLLEWANCIAVVPFLESGGQFKSGVFFKYLLRTLSEQHNDYRSFLKIYYPRFELPSDLTDESSIHVASLFLHYTCVIDGRPALTDPLCTKLAQPEQLVIKVFFENFTKDTSNREFKQIIMTCIGSETTQGTPKQCTNWKSQGDTPVAFNSPLQDFLRTPSRMGRIQEKDNEIKKLRNALQLEKYEKDDMVIELNDHKERIKKLKQQLSDKSTVISKLNEELGEIENKQPPYKTFEMQQVEKRLKDELADSQSYVGQLQQEQVELCEIRDDLNKKLRKAEEQACLWQDKAMTASNALDALQEKNQKQESELSALRVNCNELSALLDEMRSSRRLAEDSYTETDFKSTLERSTCAEEDLAHSVVEVQLRESRRENDQLATSLNVSLEKSTRLEEELRTVQHDFTQLNLSYKELQSSNELMENAILKLQESQTSIEAENRNLQAQVCSMTKENLIRKEETAILEKSLEEVRGTLAKRDVLVLSLQNELCISRTESEKLNSQLADSEKRYEAAKREGDTTQNRYESALEKYNRTNFELESLKDLYERLDHGIEHNLKALELSIFGSNTCTFDDKLVTLRNLTTKIEAGKRKSDGELDEFNKLTVKLQEEIKVLSGKEVLNVASLNKANIAIEEAKSKSHLLENTISQQTSKIEELTLTVTHLNKTIVELEEIKEDLTEKMAETKRENVSLAKEIAMKESENLRLLVEDERMKDLIKKLEELQFTLFEDIKTKEIEVTELTAIKNKNETSLLNKDSELSEAAKSLEESTLKLNEQKQVYDQYTREHLEKVNELNKNIQRYEKRIESLETDLKLAEDNCSLKSVQLEDLTHLKEHIEIQFARQSDDLSKKIDLLTLTCTKLNGEVETLNSGKQELQEQIRTKEKAVGDLVSEKRGQIEVCEKLRAEIMHLAEKLSSNESRCIEKDDIISVNNRMLLTSKLELETKYEEIKVLKETVDGIKAEKSELRAEIKQGKQRSFELERKLEFITTELQLLNKLKDDLGIKQQDLESDVLNIISQLGIKKSDLNEALDSLLEYRDNMNIERNDLKMKLHDALKLLDEANEKRLSECAENERQTRELNVEIKQLQTELDKLKSQEIENLQEIAVLKDELNYNVSNYTKALQAQRELKMENESQVTALTENVHEMVAKYNALEGKHSEILEDLRKTKHSLDELSRQKSGLELKLIEEKKCYEEDFIAAGELYKSELEALSEQQNKLLLDIERFQCEIDQENGSRVRIQNECEKAKSELDVLLVEKSDLCEKIKTLEKINSKFEANYSELKIEHEAYMKENQMTLDKTRLSYEVQLNQALVVKSELEREINELKNSVGSLKTETSRKKSHYKQDLECKEEEISNLKEQIDDLEGKLEKLESEAEKMMKQIEHFKETNSELVKNYDRKVEQSADFEMRVSKLQCAYDILETGRNKLSEVHKDLIEKCQKLTVQLSETDKKYQVDLQTLDLALRDSEEKCAERLSNVKQKDQEIAGLKEEIGVVNKILKAKEDEVDKLKKESSGLSQKLYCIEEDSERKLKQEARLFGHTKGKYVQLLAEHKKIVYEYETLKEDLVRASQLKCELERSLEEREAEIVRLRNKYDSINQLISTKDATVGSLQEDLETKLVQMEAVSKEKRELGSRLDASETQLERVTVERDELIQRHARLVEETEQNLLGAHANAIELKNDLVTRLENAERDYKTQLKLKEEIEGLLKTERRAKEFFELQALDLTNEKHTNAQHSKKLHEQINRLGALVVEKPLDSDTDLNAIIAETEIHLVELITKTRQLNDHIATLEKDKTDIVGKLAELEQSHRLVDEQKTKLLRNYDDLHAEKLSITIEKDKETKCLQNLKVQYDVLKDKYDLMMCNERENDLEEKLRSIKEHNGKQFAVYEEFLKKSKCVKLSVDKMIAERNMLENQVNNLRENHVSVQLKSCHVTEDLHRLHYEQKQALTVIIDDIQKQFSRISRMAYNISLNTCQIFEKTVSGILLDKPVQWQALYKDLNVDEVLEKIDDLKDNVINTLEQLTVFEKSLNSLKPKTRVLKENVQSSEAPVKEDDWKKKYTTIKQRLTLIENTKNNYEKKMKQLREEIKTLSENKMDDVKYTALLKEHLQAKEEFEHVTKESERKHQKILRELDTLKINSASAAHQTEEASLLRKELDGVREAYGNMLGDSSKHELENNTLRKMLDDKNNQLASLHSIKEAYEKLFEENNQLLAEIDTLKYKRNRDREEFKLVRERGDGDATQRVQAVRSEYEGKLEKMKERMVRLFKDEMDKQNEKFLAEKDQNINLLKQLTRMKEELHAVQTKLRHLEAEKTIAMDQLTAYQSGSRSPRRRETETFTRNFAFEIPNDAGMTRRASTQSLPRDVTGHVQQMEERRFSTIPKHGHNAMDVIEEVRIRRRTSINSAPTGIQMEDEGDLFNNKYLLDLKEGRFNPSELTGRESSSSRLSELAYRNSLCPPHLKSSYPAETQFINPRRFKEDDLKVGSVDLDDSITTRLLPGEKSKKKEGTTSYKKPGPPTPSKNGGRVSLQSGEFALRENRPKTSTTPSRLRSLFSRSSSSTESTSPKKRLTIFRKQR